MEGLTLLKAIACVRRGLISGQRDMERAARSSHSSCSSLVNMLTKGWKIVSPVYARPRWQARLRSKRKKAYHFVLCRGKDVNLISVLDCPEVQHFLAEKKLTVDHLQRGKAESER